MPIDEEIVRRKIKFIGEDFEKLKPIVAASYDEFMAREVAQPALERYLERIIGRMIDINYHFVRELRHLPPKDYFESFKELGNLKIVSFAAANELAAIGSRTNTMRSMRAFSMNRRRSSWTNFPNTCARWKSLSRSSISICFFVSSRSRQRARSGMIV